MVLQFLGHAEFGTSATRVGLNLGVVGNDWF